MGPEFLLVADGSAAAQLKHFIYGGVTMGAAVGAPIGQFAAVMLLLILLVIVSFVCSCFIYGKARSKSTLRLLLGLAAMLSGIVLFFVATIVVYNNHWVFTAMTGSLVGVGVLAFLIGTWVAAKGFVAYTREPGKLRYRWLFVLGLLVLVGGVWVINGESGPAHPQPAPPVEMSAHQKRAAAEIKRTLAGVWCGIFASRPGYERAYRFEVKDGTMKMSEMRVGPAWASTRCDDSGSCRDLRDTTWGEPRTCKLLWINSHRRATGQPYLHSNCEGGPHFYSLAVGLPSAEVGMSVGRDRLNMKDCRDFGEDPADT